MEAHYILFYTYVDDILARRGPHREAHLEWIRSQREAGGLTLAGALGDPPEGAAFVFEGVAPERAEAFAREDPYVRAGLVRDWRVERWNLV